MMQSTQNKGVVVLLALLLAGASSGLAAEYPIGGLTPGQRPEGAPVLSAVNHPGAWYTAALHGVSRPYPHSLPESPGDTTSAVGIRDE